MNTREYTPVPDCLALTVRKDHSLIVIKKATITTIRMSIKTLLYMMLLFCANIFI